MLRRRAGAAVISLSGLLVVLMAGWQAREAGDDARWRPVFGTSRTLVANELDVTSSGDRVARSSDWIVTSGSLFSDDGAGWTGPIDGATPDPLSEHSTGSAVFRVVSQPTFDRCVVQLDLRLDARTTTARTPAQDYDGVHVFVRYHDPWHLYAVSVARRDGTVVVKRKESPGGAADQDAGYVTLASAVAPFPLHEWRSVTVTVTDVVGGVRLMLSIDGRQLLDVVDEGSGGGMPITGPGRVGLRGDNTEFHFRDVVVTPIT